MILTLAGSLNPRSRSTALLQCVAANLADRGMDVHPVTLKDVPAEDLIYGRYDCPAMKTLAGWIERADGLVISSPVYKASFSGALKAMLDLLPENALAGKVVLPMITGGSPGHMLAMEYGLKPVLSVLGARHILAGIYATDKQIRISDDGKAELDEDLAVRASEASASLIAQTA